MEFSAGAKALSHPLRVMIPGAKNALAVFFCPFLMAFEPMRAYIYVAVSVSASHTKHMSGYPNISKHTDMCASRNL